MHQQRAAGEQQNGQRGRPWPKGTSGNPTGQKCGKRHLELHAQIICDLGGIDALSGIDRTLVKQVVKLLLHAETTKSPNQAVRASNAAARLLRELRAESKRQPMMPAKSWQQVEVEARHRMSTHG